MGGFIKLIATFCGNNLTKILAGVAVGGVVATACMATKDHAVAEEALETRKEERLSSNNAEPLTKWDKFTTKAPHYWRTALLATGTIGCIIAAEVLNASAIAGLTAAGVVAKKELEEREQKIKDMLNNKHGVVPDPNGEDLSLLPGEGKELFYDDWTGQKFWCSRARLNAVEAEASRWLLDNRNVNLSEVYELLGLPDATAAHIIEWSAMNSNGVKFEVTYETVNLHGDDMPIGVIKYKYATLDKEFLKANMLEGGSNIFIASIRK